MGYSIEYLENSNYRIEYHARAKYKFSEIRKLLKRYASDVCQTEYSLDNFEENYHEVIAWADVRKKPDDSKVVTAKMKCIKINEVIFDKSYISN